jgi:ribosomal RNA-processing protein 17
LEEHVEAVNRALREVEGGSTEDGTEDEVWGGIEDDEKENAPELVDHEEEYIDEDRYTTVTVEAVDVSKEGLLRLADDDSSEETMEAEATLADKEVNGKKKWPKKPKKKKFRYESKAERKMTRAKQKSGNKARTEARRDK